jgi:hypothetical protein
VWRGSSSSCEEGGKGFKVNIGRFTMSSPDRGERNQSSSPSEDSYNSSTRRGECIGSLTQREQRVCGVVCVMRARGGKDLYRGWYSHNNDNKHHRYSCHMAQGSPRNETQLCSESNTRVPTDQMESEKRV